MKEEIIKRVQACIRDLQEGRQIIVTDDHDRENEGDLIMAAEKVSPEQINFMATYGRGLICVPIDRSISDRLELGYMSSSQDKQGTAFTVSIDANKGTTTGISAFDRAETIRQMVDPSSGPEDFCRPGHIFPLIAREGGVLARRGHTEAAVDLSRMAGLAPAGIICEILADDGTMARGETLKNFALKHNLKMLTIEELVQYRESVEQEEPVVIPTAYGDFKIKTFLNPRCEEMPHFIFYKKGLIEGCLVRIHSECLTGDLLGSQRCDCGEQLDKALKRVSVEGGAVVYLRQEGRGIGLVNKLKAYRLQDTGMDTVDANLHLGFGEDDRSYEDAASILKQCGIESVRLLTNNPAKAEGLKEAGIEVLEQVALEIKPVENNRKYLETKKEKMRHKLSLVGV